MKIGFDFDGVICDGTSVAIDILNVKCQELGVPGTDVNELRSIGLKAVLASREITEERLHNTLSRGRELFAQRLPELSTYKGIPAVMEQLSRNHHLSIVSSNATDSIDYFLRHNHCREYFTEVVGGSGLFSKSEILKVKGFNIYVGDETRDIEAAHAVNTPVISVTYGWESEELLKLSNPDYIARTPQQILEIIQKISS